MKIASVTIARAFAGLENTAEDSKRPTLRLKDNARAWGPDRPGTCAIHKVVRNRFEMANVLIKVDENGGQKHLINTKTLR